MSFRLTTSGRAIRPVIFGLLVAAVALAGCFGGGDTAPVLDVTVSMVNSQFDKPALVVGVGSTVTWVNEDSFGHTVTPVHTAFWGTEGSGDDPADWMMEGDTWSFTFTKPGTYPYFCIPHAFQGSDGEYQGMVGTVIVKKAGAASDEPVDHGSLGGPIKEVMPTTVDEIGRDASDVPAPIGSRGPAEVTFDLTSKEVIGVMGDGRTYGYWTFDGTVPGPLLRVREGDTVTINHHNDASSHMTHNIDFHAVTGPGGGAGGTIAAPGESASITFKALKPGIYVYHCAFEDPPLHIAHGMYGLILVEPAGGLSAVDKEFYVVQGDFYSAHHTNEKGHHVYDATRAWEETPSFVVFNGRMGSLTGDRALQAEVGDSVRIFVGNGGPNLVSSFHIIGEIFDEVYTEGSLESEPLTDVQTTLVPAGGATMVELTLEYPGDFLLVDHSLHRVHKGAMGVLHVEGEEDPDVYREGQ